MTKKLCKYQSLGRDRLPCQHKVGQEFGPGVSVENSYWFYFHLIHFSLLVTKAVTKSQITEMKLQLAVFPWLATSGTVEIVEGEGYTLITFCTTSKLFDLVYFVLKC